MKEYIQTIAVFIIFLTAIPCIVFLSDNSKNAVSSAQTYAENNIEIYFTKEKKCHTYSLTEYLIGAVLAQMPADFDDEALKAQAVLAHTYILRREQAEKAQPTKALCGGLISDNNEIYQGFFTEQQAKDFYKDDYEKAYKKVRSAVEDAADYILTYKGEPVIVAFHAISSGYTENALTAWGQDIPYLQAVKSDKDKKINGIESEKIYTAQELKEKISSVYDDIEFTDLSDAKNWIVISDVNKRNYVTKLKICGREIPVSEFIEVLDISSPCFTVDFSNTKFSFISQGFGHLVGMSQYGADSMGKSGKNFKEILDHYYTDCTVEKTDSIK